MFWKYNSPSSVQIDALLQQENVSLQDLMEEDELLQECKAQNKKVVDYLTQPEVLEELVTLLVTDPSPDRDLQMRFKYANLASELLTCDVPAIVDKVASSSNLLQMLYKFLKKDKPLNPLLASFVSKVFGMLVQRRTEQNWYSYQFTCFQVLDFLKSQGDFVEVAVKHIGTSAVMDLLSKLICGVDDDDQELKRGIHEWLNDCRLIEQLTDKLSPDCDSEEHSSVDQLLCEIVATGQDTSNSGSDSQTNGSQSRLLSTLESKEVIDKLMDSLLHEERSESSVSHVINLLLNLLSFKGPHKQSNVHHTNSIEGLDSDFVDSRTSVLRTIVARLPDLQKILMQPTKLGNLMTAYGVEVERLGSTRLKVVNLITALVATQDIRVHAEMATLQTLQLLFELFFKFSLNNFLHTQVSQCVTCILSQPVLNGIRKKKQEMDGLNNNPQKLENGKTGEGEVQDPPSHEEEGPLGLKHPQPGEDNHEEMAACHPLLVQLFTELNIVQKILDCYASEKAAADENHRHNVIGYMGHIRDIANTIVLSGQDGPCADLIQYQMKQLPDSVITEWEEFALITLAEINLKNKIIPLQDAIMNLMTEVLHRDSEDETEDGFYSCEGLVILNQDFKEGDMDSIGDMRFGEDFKEPEENIPGGGHRFSNQVGGPGLEMEERFEEMCSEKNVDFDDLWKFREENITFGTLQKSEDDDNNDNPHSSSEEEGELDEEFDSLRTAEEKMDVDFFAEAPTQAFATEWSEVFDKRGNPLNVEAGFNPWQSAPASDTTGHNSWADFGGTSPYGVSGDPFGQGDSQTQSDSTFAAFPVTGAAMAHQQHPGFQTDFSNVLFSSPKENIAPDGVGGGAGGGFSPSFGQVTASPQAPLECGEGSAPSGSGSGPLQDDCDARNTAQNSQQNSSVSQKVQEPVEHSDIETQGKSDHPESSPVEGGESSPCLTPLEEEQIACPASPEEVHKDCSASPEEQIACPASPGEEQIPCPASPEEEQIPCPASPEEGQIPCPSSQEEELIACPSPSEKWQIDSPPSCQPGEASNEDQTCPIAEGACSPSHAPAASPPIPVQGEEGEPIEYEEGEQPSSVNPSEEAPTSTLESSSSVLETDKDLPYQASSGPLNNSPN